MSPPKGTWRLSPAAEVVGMFAAVGIACGTIGFVLGSAIGGHDARALAREATNAEAVCRRHLAAERDILSRVLDRVRAQQRERHGEEVTAVLVAPMVDVGGVQVRARPMLCVAPGLLAAMPKHAPTVPRTALEAIEDATEAARAAEVMRCR